MKSACVRVLSIPKGSTEGQIRNHFHRYKDPIKSFVFDQDRTKALIEFEYSGM